MRNNIINMGKSPLSVLILHSFDYFVTLLENPRQKNFVHQTDGQGPPSQPLRFNTTAKLRWYLLKYSIFPPPTPPPKKTILTNRKHNAHHIERSQ